MGQSARAAARGPGSSRISPVTDPAGCLFACKDRDRGCDTLRHSEAPGELDPARLRAARALADGASDVRAAREAGASRASICRWQKEPAFVAARNFYRQQAIREYRRERDR